VGRVGEGIEVTAVLYEVHWRLLLTVLLFSVHLYYASSLSNISLTV
jgi:hypothetical protein